MTEVQHTISIRIDKQIVKVNCPPFVSNHQLDLWLALYQERHPSAVIVSKSWTSPNAAA